MALLFFRCVAFSRHECLAGIDARTTAEPVGLNNRAGGGIFVQATEHHAHGNNIMKYTTLLYVDDNSYFR